MINFIQAFMSGDLFRRVLVPLSALFVIYLGWQHYMGLRERVFESEQKVEQLEARTQQLSNELNVRTQVLSERENELKRLMNESNSLRSAINEKKNTSDDAPLPGVAHDYLERLRTK